MSPSSAPARSALIAAFAAIYLIWGSTYLTIRIAVETLPPFLMAATRFLTAGAVLFVLLRWRGAAWPTWQQWRDNTLAGTFLLLGGNGLVSWAEQFIPSGVTALLIGACPVFIVLIEWAWPGGHRPTLLTFVGLALGFAGVTWLAAPWENAAQGGLPALPLLALVGSMLAWSFGSIYSRHLRQPAPPFVAAAVQMLGGGAALLIAAVLQGDFARFAPTAVSSRSWLALSYLIVIGSLVGFSTYVWLIKNSTPARVSTYAYVNPIVAVFLGWVILREPISSRTIIAAGVIVAAVVIITTQKARVAPSPSTRSDAAPAGPVEPLGAKR